MKGRGLGGRNQELTLAAANGLHVLENIVFAAIATDGTDGPTEAAGGIVDGETMKRGCDRGIDINAYLENNDSYRYLEATGDLVNTGPTDSNVNDLAVMLVM